MTGTWLEEVQDRLSHLRERVTKAPEASKADLEMMVDRIATSFKTLAATAEDASNEARAGDAQRLLGTLHGLRVQGEQSLGALKAELRFIEKNLEALKPEPPRPEIGRPLSLPPKEDHGTRRLKGMEGHSERRLAGMREAVAGGFTAVSLYIDDERVQIGDPDWIKMTDDLEGTVEELKKKYRGAKVTVTPSGEREVMIEVERKNSSRLREQGTGHGMRRLSGLDERADKHWSIIAHDTDEPRVARLRDELEKHDIEAEVEPIQQPRGGERYDLLVPQSKQAEANKVLAAFHAHGLTHDRSYILPNVPDEGISERAASTPTGEDLDRDIEDEVGRWLEDEEEFELGDISEPISVGSRLERGTLEQNIGFIVRRELEKKVGKMPGTQYVVVEIGKGDFESSEDDGVYYAGGHFRLWRGQDNYAQGSFAATGMAGELTEMTINITQASGHGKKNAPLRRF